MGTANFHRTNAQGIYVKYDRENDEDGNLVFYEWDELNNYIRDFGSCDGWNERDKLFGFGRDVDSAVLSKDFWFEYFSSGFRYKIEAFITLNSG